MPALYSIASYIMVGQLYLLLVEQPIKLLLNYWTIPKKMPNGLSVSILNCLFSAAAGVSVIIWIMTYLLLVTLGLPFGACYLIGILFFNPQLK